MNPTWNTVAIPSRQRVSLADVRTLVVDDNTTNRRVIGEMLRHAGATVEACESASAALAALRSRIRGPRVRSRRHGPAHAR